MGAGAPPYARPVRRTAAVAAIGLALAGCGTDDSGLPSDTGPLPADAVTWALGDTIHVGGQTIRVGGPVEAMVEANGRNYFVSRRSDVVRVTDGGKARATDFRADELAVSPGGRYLGMLEKSDDPW